jgi:hypothetical protein
MTRNRSYEKKQKSAALTLAGLGRANPRALEGAGRLVAPSDYRFMAATDTRCRVCRGRPIDHFQPDCAGRKSSISLFDRMIHAPGILRSARSCAGSPLRDAAGSDQCRRHSSMSLRWAPWQWRTGFSERLQHVLQVRIFHYIIAAVNCACRTATFVADCSARLPHDPSGPRLRQQQPST